MKIILKTTKESFNDIAFERNFPFNQQCKYNCAMFRFNVRKKNDKNCLNHCYNQYGSQTLFMNVFLFSIIQNKVNVSIFNSIFKQFHV